ncbi:MAG: nitroreductase family protein [Traorella sp.]
MDLKEAVIVRHSVRQFQNKPLEENIISQLQKEIDMCNQESGLHIQLVLNEEKAFDGFMAHYGKFRGVKNYIALIGKKGPELDEKCGYYGERIVLKAQQLGLNTCWVALTYSKIKSAFVIETNEKLCVVIALGYGETQGVSHKSKTIQDVVDSNEELPDWFRCGVECALLAPTAMNQQKFIFTRNENKVSCKPLMGFYSKVDLGIVKYHFEIGAGKNHFDWND